MATKVVEGQLPYTGGTAINIDGNKVISVLLREENNLILVNDDNELYTDLQLVDGIKPTDDFPVGVTVGKILASDGWTRNGLLLNRKTTSGDYARWIYASNGEIYFDGGNGTWKQVYYSDEVDALFTQLRGELATVAFTGDYNDLINRPAFLQEQADWEQTDVDAPDYIKNKPTIPTVNDATLTVQKNGIGLGSFTANSSTNTTINIPVPNVINNVTSTSTSDALSANQGKVLQDQIDNLKAMGKFLSLWDCTTGLPISFPLDIPYNYSTGDYFLVETVGDTNYRPDGVQYTGTASTVVETDEVEIGDMYIYDGTVWLLQLNHGKTVSFSNLSGQPEDNANLATALNAKQDVLTFDNTPTSGSSHPVTSDGIYQAIGAIDTGVTSVSVNGGTPQTGVVNLSIPDSTSDLNNDSGFITNSVNNLTYYTPTSSLATVATTGSYSDLTNTPTIPTVNDSTITITQGGTSKGDFTTNQSSNETIALDAGFTATEGGLKIFDMPSADGDMAAVVQWLTGGGDVQLRTISSNVETYYTVIEWDGTNRTIKAENSDGTNVVVYTITYDASGTCTAVSSQTYSSGGITKIFTLASTSDLTTAQAALDRYNNGGNPIIKSGTVSYHLTYVGSSEAAFSSTAGRGSVSSSTWGIIYTMAFTLSSGTVTAISGRTNNIYLSSSAPGSGTANSQITIVI